MIYIYERGYEDFSTNGMGSLQPNVCKVSEEQNGNYKLEMDHPMDTDGLFALLKTGRVLKVPVPAMTTPFIRMPEAEAYEVWETNAKTKVYTKQSTSLGTTITVTTPALDLTSIKPQVVKLRGYTDTDGVTTKKKWKPNGNRILEAVNSGVEVTVLAKSGSWYRITTPNGNTGWAQAGSLTLVTAVAARPPETIQARKTRDQLFRIYRAEKNTETGMVKVWARHISYDLLGNALLDCQVTNKTVTQCLATIDAACTQPDHGFHFYTDSTAVIEEADWSRMGYVQALLDPDTGLAALANLRVVRDNYDIFLLTRSQTARQTVRYGSNLLGVTVDISEDGIVNRIIPVGKKKDGNPLYIDAAYVDAARNDDATIIQSKVIAYDIQVSDTLTETAAKAKLVEAAEADFAAGMDLPTISVDVDFLQLGDTEEYAAFRDLDRLYMGDLISVLDDVHDVALDAEITQTEYDVLTKRHIHMSVGITEAARTIGSTQSYALGSVSGRKIAMGTMNGSALQNVSIRAAKIALAAIQTAHIENAAITNAKIGTAAVQTANIQDAAIDAAKIKDAAIEEAKIKDLSVTSAKIADTGIDFAKIKDLLTEEAIFTKGIGDDLYIGRLYVTAANIAHLTVGELVFKDASGDLYKIGVDEFGEVTATLVEVEYQNVSAAALLNISEYVVVKSDTQPTAGYVGQLWRKTSTGVVYSCTNAGPPAEWTEVPAGELHTSYINAVATGLEILSSGAITVKSGGSLVFESGADIDMSAGGNLIMGANGQFLITAGNMAIDTQHFSITKDDEERLVLDEDGNLAVSAGSVAADRFVGDVVNSYTGPSSITVDGSIQTVINNLPKHLPYDVTINVPTGTYTEDITIIGFVGSLLTLEFSDGVIANGNVFIQDCSRIYLQMTAGATVTPKIVGTSTLQTIVLYNCGHFRASNLVISGKPRTTSGDGTTYGIRAYYSNVYVTNCDFQRLLIGFDAQLGTIGYMYNCTGGVTGSNDATTIAILTYGVRSIYGSHIGLAGTIPKGYTADSYSQTATIVGSGTGTQSPNAPPPAAPTYIEYDSTAYRRMKITEKRTGSVEYPFTDPIGWGSWSTVSYSDWAESNPRQGTPYGVITLTSQNSTYKYYEQYRWKYFGLWILPTISDLTSITSASITIQRHTDYGSTGNATIELYKHSLTTAPTGHDYSGLSDTGLSATLARGASATITLDATSLAALKAGTLKGFGLYSSGDYAQMEATITLNVTY